MIRISGFQVSAKDLKDDHGWTVLMWAALAGSLDICDSGQAMATEGWELTGFNRTITPLITCHVLPVGYTYCTFGEDPGMPAGMIQLLFLTDTCGQYEVT